MRWLLPILLAACTTAATADHDDDAFWSDTHPDDGDVAGAVNAGARVGLGIGATDDAELVEHLPVARSEDRASRRVVLRLSPGELPGLARGDRLIVPAEVEVTTRCDIGQTAPGCNYNPNIRALLLLTGNRDDTTGAGSSIALASQRQTCTHADHHCLFTFTPSDTARELAGAACVDSNSCFVNLVMWAWHPDARAGDVDDVLVGSNEGNYLDNGIVEGDQARLMAVRERGVTADDRALRETSGGGELVMPMNAQATLVYSHRLKGGDLVAGEQFLVEAKLVAAVSSRARFSTQLFVTKDPRATSGGVDRINPGAVSEHNGINCTDGTSPCTVRKVAVFRVTGDIADAVYVNVVAHSEVPGPGTARVVVRRGDGWVRSIRYPAPLAGP